MQNKMAMSMSYYYLDYNSIKLWKMISDKTRKWENIFPRENNSSRCSLQNVSQVIIKALSINTPMFTATLFTIAKHGNSQDAPLLMNGLRKCGI
jgi:hypothetical protein